MSPQRTLRTAAPAQLPPPAPAAEIGDPPGWLDREGKAEWRRVRRLLDEGWPGLLHRADRAALAAYCQTWSVLVAALRDLGERGPLVPARSSADKAREGPATVRNPAWQIAREATVQLRAWAREFGLTPSARGRMALPTGIDSDDDDDDADLFAHARE